MRNRNISADEYLNALWARDRAISTFSRAFDEVDVLLSPTCGVFAPKIGERETIFQGSLHPTMWLLTRLTGIFNCTGHPAISVPIATNNGRAMGVQLIAPHHEEAVLYRLTQAIHLLCRIEESDAWAADLRRFLHERLTGQNELASILVGGVADAFPGDPEQEIDGVNGRYDKHHAILRKCSTAGLTNKP